jgi:serine/threonine protein kinase
MSPETAPGQSPNLARRESAADVPYNTVGGSLGSLVSVDAEVVGEDLLYEPPPRSRGSGSLVFASVAEIASIDPVADQLGEENGRRRTGKPIEPVSVAVARACIIAAYGDALELEDLPVGMGGTGIVILGTGFDPKFRGGKMIYKVINSPLREGESVEDLFQRDPYQPPRGAAQLAVSEARKQRDLSNDEIPGVPAVYDYREGVTESAAGRVRHAVIAMHFVPGLTMRGRLEAGVPIETLVNDFEDVVGKVARMHEKGYVHRDLKPENILGGKSQGCFMIDFGFVMKKGQSSSAFSGTLEYAAPEQVPSPGRPAIASPQMDVYALGASLFHFVQGEPPNRMRVDPSKDRTELRNEQVARLQRAAADPEAARAMLPRGPMKCDWALEAIIRKSMAPVGERYADAGEMLSDLAARREGRLVGAFAELASPVGRAVYVAGHFLRRHRLATSLLAVGAMFVAAAGFAAELSRERDAAAVKAKSDRENREAAAKATAESELKGARELFRNGDLTGALARLSAETRFELREIVTRASDDGVREQLEKALREHEELGKAIALVLDSRRKYIEFCRTLRNPGEVDGQIRMTPDQLKTIPTPWDSGRLRDLISVSQSKPLDLSIRGIQVVCEQVRGIPELRFRREVAHRYCEAFSLFLLDRHPELLRGLPCDPTVEQLRGILSDIKLHRVLVNGLGADAAGMELISLVLERQVLLLLGPKGQAAAASLGVRSAETIAAEIAGHRPMEAGIVVRFVSELLKLVPKLASRDPLASGAVLTDGLLADPNHYGALLLRLFEAEAIVQYVQSGPNPIEVWQHVGTNAAVAQVSAQILALDPDHEPAVARSLKHWQTLEDFRRFRSEDVVKRGLPDFNLAANSAGLSIYFAYPKAQQLRRVSENGVLRSPELSRDINLFWAESLCLRVTERPKALEETPKSKAMKADAQNVFAVMEELNKRFPGDRRVVLCMLLARELTGVGKLSKRDVDEVFKLSGDPWTKRDRYIWCQLLSWTLCTRPADDPDVPMLESAYLSNINNLAHELPHLGDLLSGAQDMLRFGGSDIRERFRGRLPAPSTKSDAAGMGR